MAAPLGPLGPWDPGTLGPWDPSQRLVLFCSSEEDLHFLVGREIKKTWRTIWSRLDVTMLWGSHQKVWHRCFKPDVREGIRMDASSNVKRPRWVALENTRLLALYYQCQIYERCQNASLKNVAHDHWRYSGRGFRIQKY